MTFYSNTAPPKFGRGRPKTDDEPVTLYFDQPLGDSWHVGAYVTVGGEYEVNKILWVSDDRHAAKVVPAT